MIATTQIFLAPIFVHFALTSFVGVRTILARKQSVISGKTKLADIALNSANWPADVKKLGNNFDNQFDVPIMWYALCALILITAELDMAFVFLSWIFLISRLAHSWIHTGSNYVRYRMYAFLAGFAALAVMWVWFAIRLYFVG